MTFFISTVPSLGPSNVTANATSSTTIVVKWADVPFEHRNGQIEGFKVLYGPISRGGGVANGGANVQVKDIPNNSTFTTTLTELRKWVVYNVQVCTIIVQVCTLIVKVCTLIVKECTLIVQVYSVL